MKRLHLVPEASEANGVFQVARMLAKRDGGELRDIDGVPYVIDGKELKGPLGWVEAATPADGRRNGAASGGCKGPLRLLI